MGEGGGQGGMSWSENPYTFRPKFIAHKEIPDAIIESQALALAREHPNVGWCLPMVVTIGDRHYDVRQYMNIGHEWAANAGVLSPLGRGLVEQWTKRQTG